MLRQNYHEHHGGKDSSYSHHSKDYEEKIANNLFGAWACKITNEFAQKDGDDYADDDLNHRITSRFVERTRIRLVLHHA
jgi:hypothetical protein